MTDPKRLFAQMTKFDDLSTDHLMNILSRLNCRDVVRASIVCKEWQTAASSILKFDIPPLILYFPSSHRQLSNCDMHDFFRGGDYYFQLPNNPYDFYDICLGQAYSLRLPNNPRPRGTIFHAQDGWILIFDHFTKQMFFFSPFDGTLIQLPKLGSIIFSGAAFSAPPTSPNCVVFSLCRNDANSVQINTFRPGDNAWTSTVHRQYYFGSGLNSIAISNGVFYVMFLSGWFGAFDPKDRTWRILAYGDRKKRQFMAEYNGNIYSVRTTPVVQPIVYLLDERNYQWVKVKDFGGATFFASAITSFIRTDMPGYMRDCICFHAIRRKQCVRYSLINRRYYPENDFDPCDLKLPCSIWIDAPQDRSILEAYPA